MTLKPSKPCAVRPCTKPVVAKGHCSMHYARLVREGTAGEASSRHDNQPTVQVGFRAKPALAMALKREAKARKVTVSMLCAELLGTVLERVGVAR